MHSFWRECTKCSGKHCLVEPNLGNRDALQRGKNPLGNLMRSNDIRQTTSCKKDAPVSKVPSVINTNSQIRRTRLPNHIIIECLYIYYE